ncbi:MAG: ABC transporter substrate-binding protein, partial [Gammaproteobacteria bacterium]|nr:ABC transporter substrate-binding protein [Gammaproteobacteria bacterium]
VPAYDELIFVANRERLDDARLHAFIGAVEQSVQYIVNHPQQSWEAFVASDPALDDELNRRAWSDTLPRFALRPAALDRGRYDRFAIFLRQQGLLEEIPVLDSYAVELGVD